MIQRFGLLVWPDRAAEFRGVDRPPNRLARDGVEQTFRRLAALRDGCGVADSAPIAFRFSEGAQVLFSGWLANLERRLRGDELAPNLREHFSKYRGLAPSLALINHLADAGAGAIGEGSAAPRAASHSLSRNRCSAGIRRGAAERKRGCECNPPSHPKGRPQGRLYRTRRLPPMLAGLDREQTARGLSVLVDFDWLRLRGGGSKAYLINPRGLQ